MKLASQHLTPPPSVIYGMICRYLPDVFHGADLHEGNAISRGLQEGPVDCRGVVVHVRADHSKRHCSQQMRITHRVK